MVSGPDALSYSMALASSVQNPCVKYECREAYRFFSVLLQDNVIQAMWCVQMYKHTKTALVTTASLFPLTGWNWNYTCSSRREMERLLISNILQ